VRNLVLDQLKSKKIALLGLGVENRALAFFLRSKGICFSVCDQRKKQEFEVLRAEWGEGVRAWHLGEDNLAHLPEFELVFRTPGLSVLRPELQQARQHGVEFSSQTRLFFALSPAPILGVTGTKGKGTTVALISEILRDGPCERVLSGGNIGVPPIGFLDELTLGDLVVLELSSFQLQDLDRSPQIGVVLGIAEDHLDYHADQAEYVEAKRSICSHQTAADTLIFKRNCPQAQRFAAASIARCLAFSAVGEVEVGVWVEAGGLWWRPPGGDKQFICAVGDIPLRGGHNLENAAAAAAAAAAAGAPVEQIAAGIRRFKGLEHRLERVGERGGVVYYNDSLGTTPAAASAAIRAFEEPVLLIAGGASKGADFAPLGEAIAGRGVKAIILIGAEAPRIEAAIVRAGGFKGELVRGCTSMAAAVAAARERARCGDVILLSPGCASFGMFENYKDRGEQFRCQVLD
jgi:UDP-N-acetylmuramoylalanine--D-glutamate ligase